MYFIIDSDRGSTGAVAQAIDRFQCEQTVAGGFTVFDAQACLDVILQFTRTHGLTGFRAAQVKDVLSGRLTAKVVIKLITPLTSARDRFMARAIIGTDSEGMCPSVS